MPNPTETMSDHVNDIFGVNAAVPHRLYNVFSLPPDQRGPPYQRED